jgi:hypothetical protein
MVPIATGGGFVSLDVVVTDGRSAMVRLCGACRAEAVSACERCGIPICRAHQPRVDRRCVECETTYVRRRPARVLFYIAAMVSTSVALVVGLLFLVVATGGGALGVAPLILFGSFPVLLHWLENRSRAHFLAERRGAPALPTARLLR